MTVPCLFSLTGCDLLTSMWFLKFLLPPLTNLVQVNLITQPGYHHEGDHHAQDGAEDPHALWRPPHLGGLSVCKPNRSTNDWCEAVLPDRTELRSRTHIWMSAFHSWTDSQWYMRQWQGWRSWGSGGLLGCTDGSQSAPGFPLSRWGAPGCHWWSSELEAGGSPLRSDTGRWSNFLLKAPLSLRGGWNLLKKQPTNTKYEAMSL